MSNRFMRALHARARAFLLQARSALGSGGPAASSGAALLLPGNRACAGANAAALPSRHSQARQRAAATRILGGLDKPRVERRRKVSHPLSERLTGDDQFTAASLKYCGAECCKFYSVFRARRRRRLCCAAVDHHVPPVPGAARVPAARGAYACPCAAFARTAGSPR